MSDVRDAGGEADDGAPVDVLIVGDGPVTTALEPMAVALGWRPTVTADVPVVGPQVAAVVVLSHHDGVDGPAIKAALAAGTPYIGAMGSRRTQERRRSWLLENGVTEADLAQVRAPIGLDIGADTPGEIAVSILAEVVAARRRQPGADDRLGSVSEREGPIHPELPPDTATCPGG